MSYKGQNRTVVVIIHLNLDSDFFIPHSGADPAGGGGAIGARAPLDLKNLA